MTLPGTETVSRDHLYLSAAPADAAPARHMGQPGDLVWATASTGSAASRIAMVFTYAILSQAMASLRVADPRNTRSPPFQMHRTRLIPRAFASEQLAHPAVKASMVDIFMVRSFMTDEAASSMTHRQWLFPARALFQGSRRN